MYIYIDRQETYLESFFNVDIKKILNIETR